MKRRLDSIDTCIPEKVWDMFPEKKENLKKIKELEQKLEDVQHSMRSKYARIATPQVTKKMLRVFMHHQFVPTSPEEKAHFLVSVEGLVLCPKLMNYVHLGNFFDKMIFQIEKKAAIEKTLEWSAANHPEGVKSDCFRFKIYGDKPQILKAYFYRSNDPRPRYEISEKLRALFPYMPIEVPEEDVYIAMWAYIQSNDLFVVTRDKKLIRCDDNLKLLVGTQADTCPATVLPARISENLTISSTLYPIQMDYPLSTASTKLDSMFASFGPSQFARLGGRAMDIEVDVLDFTMCEAVRDLGQTAADIIKADSEIAKMEPSLRYQATCINRLASQLFADPSSSGGKPTVETLLGVKLPFEHPAVSVSADAPSGTPVAASSAALDQLSLYELVAWAADSARLLEHRKDVPWAGKELGVGFKNQALIDATILERLQTKVPSQTLSERLRSSLGLGTGSLSAIHTLREFIDVGSDADTLRVEGQRRIEEKLQREEFNKLQREHAQKLNERMRITPDEQNNRDLMDQSQIESNVEAPNATENNAENGREDEVDSMKE